MNKQTKVWLVLSIALSLLVLGACGGSGTNKEATPGTTASDTGGTPPPSGPTGTISGVISYNGTPPAPKKIDTTADPVCGQKSPNLSTDDTLVKDGKLANTFVYIKDGTVDGGKKIGEYTWPTPTESVKLDQNGCHYAPHVLGIMVNQKISITNSDATQHNIHPTPKLNPEWNQTQANGAPPIEKQFGRAEVLIPVKCNQHPWMKSYIGVLKHPLYAVSATDGSFSIPKVPPGKYTVVAWREGVSGGAPEEATMEVTVTANGTAKADFAFPKAGAATSSTKPSLQMMPAIEFPMMGKH